MKSVEWTDAMSVGSDVLDGHHKMIIDCLNRLQPLIGSEEREADIASVVEALEEFVLIHFSEEEQCMKKAGYPDWQAHKEQHDRMFDIVFGLKADLDHGRTIDAERLFELFYDWLLQHILGEDRKYMSYIANPTPHPTAQWSGTAG
ncbi:MAG: bacteriohemerythrin [Azospirillum sp.]|nr:bacteriohemerythrin [Azospirillum sp.]